MRQFSFPTSVAGPAQLLTFVLLLHISYASQLHAQPDTNREACNRVLARAYEKKLIEKPMGDVIAAIAKEFLGCPYEANTLDQSAGEELVVNLKMFDCVTLVENVLALSRVIKKNMLTFEAYSDELELIRYRAGKRSGYSSRLHYFSDWIDDNSRKGIVRDATKSADGSPFRKRINFMSSNRNSYPQLAADSNLAAVKEVETKLSQRKGYYIPKNKIRNRQTKIRNGDIIAITTHVPGLDVSHTGIAVRGEDGMLQYLHAPDIGDSVRISSEPLWRYVQKKSTSTGIIVVRGVDP